MENAGAITGNALVVKFKYSEKAQIFEKISQFWKDLTIFLFVARKSQNKISLSIPQKI